jgi:hypothetical protein
MQSESYVKISVKGYPHLFFNVSKTFILIHSKGVFRPQPVSIIILIRAYVIVLDKCIYWLKVKLDSHDTLKCGHIHQGWESPDMMLFKIVVE